MLSNQVYLSIERCSRLCMLVPFTFHGTGISLQIKLQRIFTVVPNTCLAR